jgi:hypothetical protein
MPTKATSKKRIMEIAFFTDLPFEIKRQTERFHFGRQTENKSMAGQIQAY